MSVLSKSDTELKVKWIWHQAIEENNIHGFHQGMIYNIQSIGWFKGKIRGKSHISWEDLCFPVDFPLSQPIDSGLDTLYVVSFSDNGPL